MDLRFNRKIRSWKTASTLLALSVLTICIIFTIYPNYKSAVSGMSLNVNLEVIGISSCTNDNAACRFNSGKLKLGDRLIKIGNVTKDQIISDRRLAPFGKYRPGDLVPVTIERADEELTFDILMIQPNMLNQTILMIANLLIFGPFWLVGFFFSQYMVPRDSRWRLQIAFYYLTALWIAIGIQSSMKYAYSSLIMHALTWILVPVYVNLHLLNPAPLYQKGYRFFLPLLYAVATLLAFLELFQLLPAYAYLFGLIISVTCIVTILVYRAFSRRPPGEQISARIMMSGVILAFGPGIFLWVLPKLFFAGEQGIIATVIIMLALPILPLFYGYSVSKRWLGQHEHRLNRFLSHYALFILYLILFSMSAIFISLQPADLSTANLLYSLIILSAFILAALPLNEVAQKFMSRLAYGSYYQKPDIVHRYAGQILNARSNEELVSLIVNDLGRTLSIHQSALIAIKNGQIYTIYRQEIDENSLLLSIDEINEMVDAGGIYLSPGGTDFQRIQEKFEWLRLIIPLNGRQELIGLWLFGGRDPDDYYTQTDIELLADLSRQMASRIETRQLFSALEEQLKERLEAEKQTALFAERLTLLHQLDQSMLAAETPEEIAQAALTKLADIVGCSRASVINISNKQSSLLALHDTRAINLPSNLPDLTVEVLSRLTSGKMWLVEDVSDLDPESPITDYLNSLNLTTILSTPLQLDGNLLGSLNIAYENSTLVRQEWKDIAQEIANSLVLAIQNARLRDTITRYSDDLKQLSLRLIKVQENERKQISYELHDEIGQILTAIMFDLSMLEQEGSEFSSPTLHSQLSDAKQLVEQLMNQVRTMSLELRPSMLQDLGLAPTLRWYVNTYSDRREMTVHFDVADLTERFKEEVEIALYRVFQEALSNVSRHAQANSVKIFLAHIDHKIVGSIEDDGIGFDMQEIANIDPAHLGVGLIAMRERIAALDGVFELQSEIGKGTCIRVEVPIGETR